MLKQHHLVWLEAHPHRSPEWLADRLRDGFDIHHIDGDHANNTPDNLVLLEHADHMALHGMRGSLGRLKPLTTKGHKYKTRSAKRRETAALYSRALLDLANQDLGIPYGK